MFWKRTKPANHLERGCHRLSDGRRIYAIGDIHGRDDLFAGIIDQIRADSAARDALTGKAAVTIILLGDLVDRGPQSAQVVDRAIALRQEFDDLHLIIGNHEECFLAALTGSERRVRYFSRIGGEATMRSYWPADEDYDSLCFSTLATRLPQHVPQAHIDFLNAGEDLIQIDDFVFVHAGVRPGVPLERQKVQDMRWIREEFLDDFSDHGGLVIHGHTITDEPDIQINRIGIDTGAFMSGRLTAIGIEGEELWYLRAEN